jgi:hypothetical protein
MYNKNKARRGLQASGRGAMVMRMIIVVRVLLMALENFLYDSNAARHASESRVATMTFF